jgi:hypothetical protein
MKSIQIKVGGDQQLVKAPLFKPPRSGRMNLCSRFNAGAAKRLVAG